jgi:hypothetical protein
VQVLSYIFRNILLLIGFCFIFNACQDIPRDNVLDPKNPESSTRQILAVEAFVNTNNALSYNQNMLNALDLLNDKYPDKLTIMQYHRNVGSNLDSLHEDLNEILYDSYVQGYQAGSKGVPDVFINGLTARIQGATSVANALFRLEEAIQPLLVQNDYFTLELKASRNNSEVTLSAKIARLGSSPIDNILVKALIVENIDNQLHKRVVRDMQKSSAISKMNPGEIKEIDFDSYTDLSNSDLRFVGIVTSENELNIYQSNEVRVP